MVDKILYRQVDMVVGDRLSSTYFKENKRPFHNSGNALVRYSINKLFQTEIKDIMTGYRAFSYLFVKSFSVVSKGFEIETEMSIHAADKNMFIEHVVVDYRNRPVGSQSKLDTYSDGIKVLNTIVRLFRTYKPMNFFGLLSIILMVLGVTFVIPVLIEYFETGLVDKYPTLFVCCFVILTAIISWFSGMILQTITWKNRQDFEMRLNQVRERYEEIKDL